MSLIQIKLILIIKGNIEIQNVEGIQNFAFEWKYISMTRNVKDISFHCSN